MTRPTMQDTIDAVAEAYAARSTCGRLNVGAVIHTAEGVVLSTGYNGALSGQPHCDHSTASEPCDLAVHAEANAISFAARRGVALAGQCMTVTHAPCVQCAKLIHQAGIVRVRYLNPYRSGAGIALLKLAYCVVDRRLKPLGRHEIPTAFLADAGIVCRNCPELIEQVPPGEPAYGERRWRHAGSKLVGCGHGLDERGNGPRAEPRNAPAGDVPVIPGKDDR